MPIRSKIRTIPDYPREGIQFRDITSLLLDPSGFRLAVDELVQVAIAWSGSGRTIEKVAGIEARGFVLGGAVAHQLGAGFVPVRKAGKLPGPTIARDYELEYGTDRLEIHRDAISPSDRVLVLDDLLATGGTALAAISLVRELEAEVVGACFVIDLPDLGGSARLSEAGVPVRCLTAFEGE